MPGDDLLRAELARVARALGAPDDVTPLLERPRDPEYGDWATNLAMTLAKPLGKKPRDIAREIVDALDLERAGASSAEIAGPGFINFRVATGTLARGLQGLVAQGKRFGRGDIGRGKPVNVEFVSANPTGPLHVGHGRQAALGDAIASLLEWTGWNVSREFYYNDGGAQIMNLVASVQARIAQLQGRAAAIPEGGYHGEYIKDVAQRYIDAHGGDVRAADPEALRRFVVEALRQEQDRDLQAFGVKFDTYFLESSLYAKGKVDETMRRLVAAGHAYER